MPRSYSKVYLHCVWSVKNQKPLITPDFEEELYNYMAGTYRELGMIPYAINGMYDHIHTVHTLSRTMTIAKVMATVKANSSKWLNETYPDKPRFTWQEGYGAFSVDHHHLPVKVNYVKKQKEHHRKQAKYLKFETEFLQLLKENGVEHDPKFLFK